MLWDVWGVPHVFAASDEDLFFAHGWAQAAAHGDLLLRLYGQARGRAAEYWGESWLDDDRWVWTNGIPARAEEWLQHQNPT
ncbi:MAG TPA: penicillin acylase family protein, partial [Thermoanaerobaculia bacterium]|nr:penicillin acylase family protein [Thermoanaerobaculia bacterium]